MSASDYGINADDREHDLLAENRKLSDDNKRLQALLTEVVDCYDIDPTLRATIDAFLAGKK